MVRLANRQSRLGWGFPADDIIVQSRLRLPRTRLDEVARLGGLTKKEMAYVLGMTERNLYNQHEGLLSVPLSERLLILQRLFDHGLAVFDQQADLLYTWLRTPLAELATPEAGFTPVSTNYVPKPITQMGTKTAPPSLSSLAQRRERVGQQVTADTQPYPTPLSLLDTVTGCQLVDYVFIRVEAGVFS